MDRGTVGGGPRTVWVVPSRGQHPAGLFGTFGVLLLRAARCTLQWAGRYGWVPGYAGHSWHSADKTAYTVQRLRIDRYIAYSTRHYRSTLQRAL